MYHCSVTSSVKQETADGASFKLTRFNRVGLDWVGLSCGLFGDCQMLNLCFGCWITWNSYKPTILFAGLEPQTPKLEDSHDNNLSSCNLTVLWTFHFLVFSTSMATDLKHVVVIQEFVAWQGWWTNPLCVCIVLAIVSYGCWNYVDWHDTPLSSQFSLLIWIQTQEVTMSWGMLGVCNLQFTWRICAFHFHFNITVNLKQVRVDKFVIIKGMAKDQNLLKHR